MNISFLLCRRDIYKILLRGFQRSHCILQIGTNHKWFVKSYQIHIMILRKHQRYSVTSVELVFIILKTNHAEVVKETNYFEEKQLQKLRKLLS